MAGHCEALLVGKQHKMSNLMGVPPKHDNFSNFSEQPFMVNLDSYGHTHNHKVNIFLRLCFHGSFLSFLFSFFYFFFCLCTQCLLCEPSDYVMKLEKLQVGNPFVDNDYNSNFQMSASTAMPLQCSTEYKHNPNGFRLPASSPYDNFLKAAGC